MNLKKNIKISSCFAFFVVLLIAATVASATVIPPNSILVATGNRVVALDLSGNVVGYITPTQGEGLITDVLQVAPNGDILLCDNGVGQVPVMALTVITSAPWPAWPSVRRPST